MKGRARAWLAVVSLTLIAGSSAWWLSRPGNSVESVSGRPASGLGASSGAPDSAAAGLEQAASDVYKRQVLLRRCLCKRDRGRTRVRP